MGPIVTFCALHHNGLSSISTSSACHDAAFVATGLVKAAALDGICHSRGGNVSRSRALSKPKSDAQHTLHWMDLS
jgi:hypothetical protein